MVAKCVEEPRHLDVHAELFATVTFAVLHLAHKQLTTRFDVIRHYVHSTDDFQPPLSHKPPERSRFFRIPFEEGPEIRNLIEREFVLGILFQKLNRLQNIRQAHLQIFFPRLKHRAFPVRVRDVEKLLLARRLFGGRTKYRSAQ